MDFKNYNIIASFLSSSEINRCKRNGLEWYTAHSVKEWNDYFKSEWMPRKLRRKLRHLYHCNVLPVKVAQYMPIMAFTDEEQSFIDSIRLSWAKAYMDAEDEFILKGIEK